MQGREMQMVLSPALTLDCVESVRLFILSSVRFWSKARVHSLSFNNQKLQIATCFSIVLLSKKLDKFNTTILFIILWGENEGEKTQMDLGEPGDAIQLHFSVLLIWLNSYCKRLQR